MKKTNGKAVKSHTMMAALAVATCSATTFANYPAPQVSGPAGNVTFPETFSAFDPPIENTTPGEGAPEIYEYSRDNDAGDVMIITGGNFSCYTNNVFSKDLHVFGCKMSEEYGDTVALADYNGFSGFVWTPSTVIEITASTYRQPDNGDKLFYATENGNKASIYYDSGRWYAQDGAGGNIDLGAYDADVHVFRYDCAANTVGVDGNSFSLRGTVTDSSEFYIGCNSPGYEDYPALVKSFRMWQDGVLIIDAVAQVDGTFLNRATMQLLENNERVIIEGDTTRRPFHVAATRNLSVSGEQGMDSAFVAYGTGATNDCSIMRLDGANCAIVLPSSLPSGEMYMVWPRNAHGYGLPAIVNQTEAWWVGPDRVESGKTFSVYGRNLGENCHIYVEELQQWFAAVSCNPYKAEFRLPGNTPKGTYTLWVHNTKGQEFGWSDTPLSIEIKDAYAWTGNTVNVKDFGAKGDGSTDDYQAIINSLASSSPGDTVYFPAGTYALSASIGDVSNRKLVGEGIDATILTDHPASTSGKLFSGTYHNVVFSNMTMEATAYKGNNLVKIDAEESVLDNIKLNTFNWPKGQYLSSSYNFENSHRLLFKDCIIVTAGSPGNLTMSGSRQVAFDGCSFLGAKECSIMIGAWAVEEVSVENCTSRCYDDSADGYFDGRWFVTAAHWGGTSKVYFGGNASFNTAPPPNVDGYHLNTGEQVLFEGGYCYQRGLAVSATPDTVRINESLDSIFNTKFLVTIVSGKGFGQTRRVESIDTSSNTITLEKPWRVVPDQTSMIYIGTASSKVVLYGNHLDGRADWAQGDLHCASAGFEPNGGSADLVADSNVFTDFRAGIMHWPMARNRDGGPKSLETAFFNTFQNNIFSNCYLGVVQFSNAEDGYVDGGVMGTTLRNNTFAGISKRAINYSTSTTGEEPTVRMNVYEDNIFNDCAEAITESAHLSNQLYVDNVGTNGGVAMSLAYDHVPALFGNQWNGYGTDYQRGPSIELPLDHILELPIRNIHLDNTLDWIQEHRVPVWNVAPSSMVWTASTSADWINLTKSTGTIAGQSDLGEISMEIAPLEVNSTGTVKVVSGDQSKYLTVVYEVDASSPPPPDPPPAPVLVGVTVSGPASVTEGKTAQYTCTASYSDGTTSQVVPTWSDDSSYASINTSGLLSAGDVPSDQSITLTASYNGVTDTHSVTIVDVPVVLTGIQVAGPATVDEQTTAQYTCTASYSDGTSQNVAASWGENSPYASISASGLLSAADVTSDKSVTITASYGGFTDTHVVTIKYIPPVVTGIVISGPSEIDEETTAQYTCTANYSDGSSKTVTPTWSENSAYASINASGLLAAGNVTSDRSVTVTASFGGFTDTHDVTIKYVPPTLVSITITGPTSVDEETTAQYTCEANWSDGTITTITPTWSENSAYATISASGLFAAGTVTTDENVVITASYGGKSDTHALAIENIPPVLTGVVVSGPSEIDEETTAQYTCTANYSDGSSQTVEPTWSENSSHATISASGLLTTGNVTSDRSVTVTASFGGFTDTLAVTIKYVAPTLAGITISGSSSVDEGATAQYTCTASYSDGTSGIVSPVWSQNSGYADISGSGLLTAYEVTVDQTLTITASLDGFTDTYTVTLNDLVVLQSVSISGPNVLLENSSTQFVCTAHYSDGTSAIVSPTWSEDSSFATIDGSGTFTSGNVEDDELVNVSASFNGKSASVAVAIWVVGNYVVYPLGGFEGKTIKADLWDPNTSQWIPLGEEANPQELIIENVNSNQWYWLRIQQFDEPSGTWVKIHGNWISM